MEEKPDVMARLLISLNKLDINFSEFSAIGWLTVFISLLLGGVSAYFAVVGISQVTDNGKAKGLVFFLAMVAVTAITFNLLTLFFKLCGMPIVRPDQSDDDNRFHLK